MIFLPKNPCCNGSSPLVNTTPCNVEPVLSENVKYSGPSLSCTEVQPCDSLSVVLQKMNEQICDIWEVLNSLTTTTTTTQLPTELCLEVDFTVSIGGEDTSSSIIQSFLYEGTQPNGYYSYNQYPAPEDNSYQISYLTSDVRGYVRPNGDGWYFYQDNDDLGVFYYSYSPSTTQNVLLSTGWTDYGGTGPYGITITTQSFSLTEGFCSPTTTSTTTT